MIEVGTSGYSYEDWKGAFYPERLPSSRMLEFYARHFLAVELNSSFYRIPEPRMMEAIVRKAEGRVELAVKANQNLTRTKGKTFPRPSLSSGRSSGLSFFNNHPRGQAIQNAQVMIHLLAERGG